MNLKDYDTKDHDGSTSDEDLISHCVEDAWVALHCCDRIKYCCSNSIIEYSIGIIDQHIMAIDILPWLLRGHERDEYKGLEHLKTTELISVTETIYVVVALALIIVSRCIFNIMTQSWSQRIGKAMKIAPSDMNKVLEEFWTLLGNVGTLGLAMYVMWYHNAGCWFGDTENCLLGWPNHSIDSMVLLYYTVEFAWYIHLLLKKPLGYGEPDGPDMMMHHVATLSLIILSKACNVTRAGVLVLTLFSISNPFLHAAKICNQILPSIRVPMFSVFSILFVLTRVIMVPPVILRVSMYQSIRLIPYAVEDFYVPFVLFNGLLVLLYGMQLKWMWAILRVLTKSATEGSAAAGRLSANLDPSKRFKN